MKLSFLAAGMVALAVTAWATGERLPLITKHEALKAIAAFREDPLSDLGRGAGALIITFADEDHDVSVRISPKTVPFLSNKSIPQEIVSTLLVAFTAGNIDSQLLRNEKKDDSYSGVLQVIETYRQLQKKKPKLRIAEVEKFIDLERQGKLRAYAAPPSR
jgi:hypothetical protein